MKCKICENYKNNKLYDFKEMQFGFREKFKYFQCSNCNCLQIMEIPSKMEKYYPSNYYSYFHQGPYQKKDKNFIIKAIKDARNNYAITNAGIMGRIIYSIFPNEYLKSIIDLYFPCRDRKNLLNKAKKILDVGCGCGNLLWHLKEFGFRNLLGVDPYIIDDITYSNGLKIFKKDIDDLSEKFDLIMFHHSFEHLQDPLKTLQSASRLLIERGTCLLRIPLVDSYAWEHYRENWFALDAPRHFFLHSIKSIEILADKVDLVIKQIIYDSTEQNLWASEQYAKNIPFESEMSYIKNKEKSAFSIKDIKEFKKKAVTLNKEGNGDQAAFYLERL